MPIELFFFPVGFLVIVVLLVIVFSVSFLMAVISPPSAFLCIPRVVVLMRQHCLQCWQVFFLPPFLIHIVCQRRFWDVMTYAWSLVFLFFGPFAYVLRSFTSKSFRISNEGRGTVQVFIPLIRFLLHSFVSGSFLVLQIYYFLFFSFISTCSMVSASKMPKYLYVSFSLSVLILYWFGSSIHLVRCRSPLFITSIAHFAMPNSIRMSWLYILAVCISFQVFFIVCK